MDPRNIHLPILLLLLLLPVLSSALFSPADNQLFDCGSTSPSTSLSDHRVFLPDSRIISDGVRLRSADSNPNLNPLYRTARVFTTPSSYRFQIKHKGTHILRLHFYPFSSNLSSAHFHVIADNDVVLLSNFAYDSSAAPSPTLKEYLLRLDTDSLLLSFVPADPSTLVFVNAIELFSAPANLLPDQARLVGPTLNENFNGLSYQALETLYRINVAGPKVTPFNDTLWRTWLPDSPFILPGGSDSKAITFSGRIAYRQYGASREVGPDNVYNSARVSRVSNMTWVFPVDSGYKYLVRMHFCDIASLALNEIYLNLYVNGYVAYQDLDLSDATDQVLASPYYLDLVVDVENTGLLSVVVGPSNLSDPSKVGGLLNGLEIMKINNTIGSLSAGVPSLLAMRSSRSTGGGGSGGAMARSLMCGFMFVALLGAAFMVMLRWKAETGREGRLAWSPLPLDVSDGRLGKGSVALAGKFMYF